MEAKIKKGDYLLYEFRGGFPNFENENRKPFTFLGLVLRVSEDDKFKEALTLKDIKCLTKLIDEDDTEKRRIHIPLDSDYTTTLDNKLFKVLEVVKPIYDTIERDGETTKVLSVPKMIPQYYI